MHGNRLYENFDLVRSIIGVVDHLKIIVKIYINFFALLFSSLLFCSSYGMSTSKCEPFV